MSAFIPILPESAPFSSEQRAWLNGLFAGWLGGQNASSQSAPPASAAPVASPTPADNEDASTMAWHDPALPMGERLKLAESNPPKRQLMAAMAQLDCGACGYLCKTYAEAIDSGAESNLTLCSPGGAPTAKKLKELVKRFREEGASAISSATTSPASAARPNHVSSVTGFDRNHPYPAPLIACSRLTKRGSAKDTRFVSLDISGSGMSYEAGDSLGVWPENCYEHVDNVLRVLGMSGGEPVRIYDGRQMTLRDALISAYDISTPNDALIECLASRATGKQEAKDLKQLSDTGEVDGLVDNPHVIDVLARFGSARPTAMDFIQALARVRPRLYSISSSPKEFPEEIHLTVGIVRYERDGRQRKGVASTYLADRVLPREPVRVFVQPSHGFRPPQDGAAPMIMVGPGTGIAPFRAFLQERRATNATGRNWLFFGDQHSVTDYLYEDELRQYVETGLLTNLDTAFSRDQDAKLYVQHRMIERGAELWRWMRDGAHFYVCGDAKRMANDVDATLHRIAQDHGKLSEDQARHWALNLARDGRYRRDVY